MKEEIEKGKSLLNTFNEKFSETDSLPESDVDHQELLEKVERILRLFNVDDLDDIVDVEKIKQESDLDKAEVSVVDETEDADETIAVETKTNNLDSEIPAVEFDNSVLDLLDSEAESDLLDTKDDTDEVFDTENDIIHSIERKIKDILKKISAKKAILSESKSMIVALTKMLVAEMRKIKTIEGVLEDHNQKIEEAQDDIKELYSELKELQQRKINHINKLQDAAQNKQSESENLLERIQDQASKIGNLRPLKINGALMSDPENIDIPDIPIMIEQETEVSERDDSLDLKEIDRSKYDAYPLKKIISMKKIKSLTVKGNHLRMNNEKIFFRN